MASSANPRHNDKVRSTSIREWSDPKNDSRYVTRHELKSFLTIYDKMAARIRGEERKQVEDVLLLTLKAFESWRALPWWLRLFRVPAVPRVEFTPAPGLDTKDAERAMPEPEPEPSAPVDVHGASTLADPAVAVEGMRVVERPWRCLDCRAEGRQHFVGLDTGASPTCLNCGGRNTVFTDAGDGA